MEHCQIPNAVEKLLAASHCSVAFLGGSLTVGVGASNVAETSWRALTTHYLHSRYHRRYHCQVSEVMGAIGACESYVAAFTLPRNVLPMKPDLALIEFCVNDSGAPDEGLVRKGTEGIIRQLVSAKHRCDVMVLGTGNRDREGNYRIHREIAEYYDLPFVDMHGYVLARLAERGQSWDDVSIEFVENDPCHLSDYGHQLSFEAIRDAFEDQVSRFKAGKRKPRNAAVPEPSYSDEFQFVQLVDPANPKSADLTLHGQWDVPGKGRVPWFFDNLTVGQPGASMTFVFEGTAVALFGLMYNNGLAIKAELDGKPIRGSYLRFFIEFGKGLVLAHGLEPGRHELKLTVGPPSTRHNKLENPTAAIGYIGVAHKPQG